MKGYILTPKLLKQYPQMGSDLKKIISVMKKSKPVYNYVIFINNQLAALNAKQQKECFCKIVGDSNSQFFECIAELTVMSLWHKLRWNYEKDPVINRKTPDFFVKIDKTHSFLAEITTLRSNHPHRKIVVRRHKRSIFELLKSFFIRNSKSSKIIIQDETTGETFEELPPSTQPIEQSHRINVEIKQKYYKYLPILRTTGQPFVVCFYQPDFDSEFYIDEFQIRNSLYGIAKMNFNTGEIVHEPELKKDRYGNLIHEGLFCFSDYSYLSAVIFIIKQYSVEKQKYYFSTSIYLNPLGAWSNAVDNPFSPCGLVVNSVDANDNIFLVDPNNLELY